MNPPKIWFGPDLLGNISQLLSWAPTYPVNYFNSFAIALISTVTTIFLCTVVGFAFAKYRFKGRNALFAFVLATLSIPQFLNIIPLFRMMRAFNWIGTWLPLIVPGMAGAFGVFIMTQFIEGAIPSELIEAARIDGLSEYGIILRIGFPLARSGIAMLGIITFIGSWNDFFTPLVFLSQSEKTTLPVILSQLSLRGTINFGAMMMGNALSILPLIIVFIFFSRQIISGLTAGSVKG
jgi:multiple sugar transport system permease protein